MTIAVEQADEGASPASAAGAAGSAPHAARPPSIRRRLSRSLLMLSGVLGLGLAIAVGFTVQEEVDELMDSMLEASAHVLAGALARNGQAAAGEALPGAAGALSGVMPAPAGEAAPAGASPAVVVASVGDDEEEEEFVWQWVDTNGVVLQRSAMAPAEPLTRELQAGFEDSDSWRVFRWPIAAQQRVLYVAHTQTERSEVQREIALTTIAVALLVGGLGMVWLSGRVDKELRPLAALSRVLAAYDPLEPGAVPGPPARSELVPVHLAIGTLGQRLRERVASERAFSAHAAHALRTPLAGIDAQLAVALRESPPPVQARLLRVRAASDRLRRVVTSLLALFRSDVRPHREWVDLADLAARLPADGFVVRAAAGGPVSADPDLLAAAISNLLDNAARLGAHHVMISSPEAGVVRVHDDGPGVSAQRREQLQHAIDTQDAEQLGGLGLILASMVARAHGGALRLPTVDTGFAADLDVGVSAV
jgi:signal transduction histidine kinase